MSEVRKIGVDPGFGGVKVAEVRPSPLAPLPEREGRNVVTAVVTSVVGVGDTNTGALNLAGVVHARREARPQRVAFEGVEYLVGAGVAQYARPIERMDFQRFTEGPELRALLYAALYQLLDGGAYQVALAVGLPVAVLQDAEQAAATEREMGRWLLGKHRFTLDGVEARFEVVALRAKIAQPLATWFDWGLDINGQWMRGAAAAKAPALIVDQGFNTLDLCAVENGRISTRYSGGDTLGMRRAAEMTAGNIQRRYGVEMSLHEADELAQQVIAGKKARVYVVGELVDVTGEARQAINALAADVVRFVEQSVGKGRKFRILLTGGGALALAPRLARLYPHAEVVDEPVTANARGLAKLAVRAGFLEVKS